MARRHGRHRFGGVGEIESVAGSWIAARALVVVALLAVTVIVNRLLPGQPKPLRLRQGLWTWDGDWYLRIAQGGYRSVPREGLRFFPLYPLLGRIVSIAFLGNMKFALLFISNAAALGCGLLVHRLVMLDFDNEPELARRSVVLFAVVPAGFVMVLAYSESLMLLFALACMLALRKQRWTEAALFAFLAALTRPLGVLLVVPILVEVISTWSAARRRRPIERAVAVASPLVGIGVFLAWAGWRFGSLSAPLHEQQNLRGGLVDPFTRIYRGFRDLAGSQSLADGLHLPFALAFIALVVVAWKWLPRSYAAYATVVVLVSITAGNWNSLERYSLNAFPVVIALAMLTIKRPKWWEPILVVCSVGVVLLSALSFAATYVP